VRFASSGRREIEKVTIQDRVRRATSARSVWGTGEGGAGQGGGGGRAAAAAAAASNQRSGGEPAATGIRKEGDQGTDAATPLERHPSAGGIPRDLRQVCVCVCETCLKHRA